MSTSNTDKNSDVQFDTIKVEEEVEVDYDNLRMQDETICVAMPWMPSEDQESSDDSSVEILDDDTKMTPEILRASSSTSTAITNRGPQKQTEGVNKGKKVSNLLLHQPSKCLTIRQENYAQLNDLSQPNVPISKKPRTNSPFTDSVDSVHSSSNNQSHIDQVYEQSIGKKSKLGNDTEKMFLFSLLPDLQLMTNKQMREFKKKVTELVSSIVDNS